jgi:hypothetical protein
MELDTAASIWQQDLMVLLQAMLALLLGGLLG